jgi:hypothetical protein
MLECDGTAATCWVEVSFLVGLSTTNVRDKRVWSLTKGDPKRDDGSKLTRRRYSHMSLGSGTHNCKIFVFIGTTALC